MSTEDADPLAVVRRSLRTLLGHASSRFDDDDLWRLKEAGYETFEDLQTATFYGLLAAKLKPARIDQIVSAQDAAADKLYNNVTMFVPDVPSSAYVKRDYQKLTKKQFTAKMESYACRQVVPVEEKPSQLLALADCADTAVDIEDVQLQDGMQLAMVVGAESASKKIEKSVETIQGWKDGRIDAGDKYECAKWAVAYLNGDQQGAKQWCFKMMTGLVGSTTTEIEIDGMAFSKERMVLVERKPRIELRHVSDLRAKVDKLTLLVVAGAPNTAMLRNPATGRTKRLKVFLMADGWADDQGEVAACAMLMEEYGITPLLPTGNGDYAEHDSCGRWPVDDSMRRRGKEYLTARIDRGAQRPSSSAGVDASTGSRAGGGAFGPNSAVGGQRHASSQQQAACSPAHPAHRLRVHDTSCVTGSGCGLRRSVVAVCRPLHLHRHRPLHQHLSSSMPSLLCWL